MNSSKPKLESAIRHGRLENGMTFNQKAWALCARVPKGKITTYAAIASAIGSPRASRAVGNAMNRNPYAPGVPCHRVVGSNGSLTGYAGGLSKKEKMLVDEGVPVKGGKVAMSANLFRF